MIKSLMAMSLITMGLISLYHNVEYAGWVLAAGLVSWLFSDPCDCD